MPSPTVLLDRVNGARLENSSNSVRLTRTAVALSIDTSVPAIALVRTLAIAGLPQIRDSLPGYPYMRVVKHLIVPLSGTAAQILILYEGPSSTAGSEIPLWIVEKSSSMIQQGVQQMRIGNDIVPIQIPLNITTKGPDGTTRTVTDKQTATINGMFPTKTVIYSRFQSPYPSDIESLFGTVNAAEFQGLPIGYWLFAGMDIRTLTQGANYDYHCTFISKVTEDWSNWVYYRLPNGQHVIVDHTTLATLAGAAYINGITTNTVGIARIGLYSLTDWGTVFSGTNLDS